jgi:pimeloyl-ACP methyl ester carboxylesterase
MTSATKNLRPPRRALAAFAVGFSCLISIAAQGATFSLTLRTEAGRDVTTEVVYPDGGCDRCTLVVFSHGAFATPERYSRLTEGWSEAGFVIASPLHVDSELHPRRDEFDGPAALAARLEDFQLVLTSTVLRQALQARDVSLDGPMIAAGHSYGGLIAQVAAGARLQDQAAVPPALYEASGQVAGVVALSPPGPFPQLVLDEDWASIGAPMLVVTGTTDILPGFMDEWQLHLRSFEAARQAPAYALVFEEQDHYFNGAFGRPEENLDEQTTAALARLIALSNDFMERLVAGSPPSPAQWLALEDSALEARVAGAEPAETQ